MGRTWLSAGLLFPAALGAQERITLRAVPVPNQVIRTSMTQDLSFDVVMDGSGMGPTKVEGQVGLTGTQRVGPRDAQGRVTSELTVDTVTMELKMNGVPRPAPEELARLRGQTFTVVYDAGGKVVDVTASAGMGPAGVTAKNMISTFAQSIPSATLGIGDTITVQLAVPRPIPIPGIDTPTTLDSKTTSKLVSIVREGSDRIATLEQRTEAEAIRTLEVPSPSGMVSANLELRMTGGGNMQLNVDKGFVKSASSDLKLDTTMLMQGMSMKLNGTIHMVVTGTSQPAG